MVDHTNGGVWHKINYPDLTPRYQKVHLWKNGYHSFEHALIGYITDRLRDKEPVILYYALPEGKQSWLQPYYYSGKAVSEKQRASLVDLGLLRITRIEFEAP